MGSFYAGEFHSSAGKTRKFFASNRLENPSTEKSTPARRSAEQTKSQVLAPPRESHKWVHTQWFDSVARQEHSPRTGNFSLGELCSQRFRNAEMDPDLSVKLRRAQRAIFVLALGLVLTALAVDAKPLPKNVPVSSVQNSAVLHSR